MTKVENLLQSRKTFFVFVAVLTVAFCVTLPLSRVLKRDKEIDGILERTSNFDYCIQYALITTVEGYYPCFNCPEGHIYLHVGEVWKYGQTCKGETGRYPNGLPFKNLVFKPQFYGIQQACLVEEKLKIYAYPALPECQRRTVKLLRPPGNKIDR